MQKQAKNTFFASKQKNSASVSLHFASKQKGWQFSLLSFLFLPHFFIISLQISTSRINAKTSEKNTFSHQSEKKFASVSLHFASKRK
jgi:hypothetical protein